MMINTQSLIEKGLFVLGMLLHTQIPRVIFIIMKLREHIVAIHSELTKLSTGPQHNPCIYEFAMFWQMTISRLETIPRQNHTTKHLLFETLTKEYENILFSTDTFENLNQSSYHCVIEFRRWVKRV